MCASSTTSTVIYFSMSPVHEQVAGASVSICAECNRTSASVGLCPKGTKLSLLDTVQGKVVYWCTTASKVGEVQGHIQHVPHLELTVFSILSVTNTLCFKSFLDGVLVWTRDGHEDELTSVRVSWVYREVIAGGHNVNGFLDVAELKVWGDSLCV